MSTLILKEDCKKLKSRTLLHSVYSLFLTFRQNIVAFFLSKSCLHFDKFDTRRKSNNYFSGGCFRIRCRYRSLHFLLKRKKKRQKCPLERNRIFSVDHFGIVMKPTACHPPFFIFIGSSGIIWKTS